jgi:hypothetical protein
VDVKQTLTEIETDLKAAKHADAVQGADVSQRGERYDSMVTKIERTLATIEAEEAALGEKGNRS